MGEENTPGVCSSSFVVPLHYLEGIVQGCPVFQTNNATLSNSS